MSLTPTHLSVLDVIELSVISFIGKLQEVNYQAQAGIGEKARFKIYYIKSKWLC